MLRCPEHSRRHSIVLESFPNVEGVLTPRTPPEVAGPPPAMSETIPPPATAITEAPSAARPKQAANAAHKRQNLKGHPPEQSAQLHARRARNQRRGIPGRIVREVTKALSDVVAVRISPNSAVEGSNW